MAAAQGHYCAAKIKLEARDLSAEFEAGGMAKAEPVLNIGAK